MKESGWQGLSGQWNGRCIKGLVSFAVEPAEVRGHDLELYHLRIISFSLGLQETAPTEYGRVCYDTDPRWHWPIKWGTSV